jgi:ribonuclease T1
MRMGIVARWYVAAALALVASGLAPVAAARSLADAPATVAVPDLPSDARETLERIHRGGPFRYERDGIAFGNREHLLPPKARGYYHEYTVPTPGAKSRGARRIVCGGPPARPEVCYYSDDHYQSFRRIAE